MKNKLPLITTLFISLICLSAFSQNVQFDPQEPVYIELHTNDKSLQDIVVQIEDAKGPAKIRLALQTKPNSISAYYGYMWLQIGKPNTNQVLFKKNKNTLLKGWLTEQDGYQAVFLFENEQALNDFKNKAQSAKKPLVDKKDLPVLVNTPAATNVNVNIPTNKPIVNENLELSETARYGKMISSYNQFTDEQKKLNNQRAEDLANQALKLYQQKNYKAAENNFAEALKLNPLSSINQYYYAVCLYQNKKYEKSLTYLALAEGSDYNQAEYKFYSGLNHLKLKNYSKALEYFTDTKEENDPDYSPSAAFFSGHIQFQKEDYNPARQNFEYVIDQSKNPKLDRESELMLDKIDLIEGYQNQMKERFKYSLFFGAGYDSNVLNISTENTATNLAAYRFMYGTQLNYKFFFNYNHDLSIDFSASDYYSLNNTLKSDATIQSADPLQLAIGLPYHLRFQAANRLYTWGLTPSYQIIYMNLDGGSQRQKILDSTLITTDLNFAFTNQFFAKFALDYSMDKSHIDATTSANDLTADKMTVSTVQTYLLDTIEKRSLALDLSYAKNSAKGDNNIYNKYVVGFTFSSLGLWNAQNTARLDYTDTKYPNNTSERADKLVGLTLSLSKDLTKKLNLNLSVNYNNSTSTVDTYKYNKFGFQSILTYSGAF